MEYEVEAKAKQILESAYSLIKNPRIWIQEDEARDSTGTAVDATDADACQFCALGAINHVIFFASAADISTEQYVWESIAERAFDLLAEGASLVVNPDFRRQAIAQFNDKPLTTHRDVIDAYKAAIAS